MKKRPAAKSHLDNAIPQRPVSVSGPPCGTGRGRLTMGSLTLHQATAQATPCIGGTPQENSLAGKCFKNVLLAVIVLPETMPPFYESESLRHPILGQGNTLWVGRTDDLAALKECLMPDSDVTYPSGMDAFNMLPWAILFPVHHGLPVGCPLSLSIGGVVSSRHCWCSLGAPRNTTPGSTCRLCAARLSP
jgi:hypothetical protein